MAVGQILAACEKRKIAASQKSEIKHRGGRRRISQSPRASFAAWELLSCNVFVPYINQGCGVGRICLRLLMPFVLKTLVTGSSDREKCRLYPLAVSKAGI